MKLMNNESCKSTTNYNRAPLSSCKAHEESLVNKVNYSRHGADGEWKLTDDSTGINNISFLSAGRRNRFFLCFKNGSKEENENKQEKVGY